MCKSSVCVCVCQSCVNQSIGQLKCEWTAHGLYFSGFSGTFSCCCTVELSWIYCIFFSLRERFRVTFTAILWWLFENCKLYSVHNCSLCLFWFFSIGIPYKRSSSNIFFSLLPLRLWKIRLYSCKSLSSPPQFFFSFSRAMIKRSLKTVNKYYCVEIWMSLQKCIRMS